MFNIVDSFFVGRTKTDEGGGERGGGTCGSMFYNSYTVYSYNTLEGKKEKKLVASKDFIGKKQEADRAKPYWINQSLQKDLYQHLMTSHLNHWETTTISNTINNKTLTHTVHSELHY